MVRQLLNNNKYILTNKRYFLKQFLKEKKTVGSVAPSSKHLAKKMLKDVDFENGRVFVELGPGTGVFTREIVKNMNPEAKLFVFELHKPFHDALKQEFENNKQVIIVNDSAEKICEVINAHNIKNVDAILSSLPLANFNKKLVQEILNNAHKALKVEGVYVQFQYSLKSKKYIKRVFNNLDLTFTARNLPPAFVYTSEKK